MSADAWQSEATEPSEVIAVAPEDGGDGVRSSLSAPAPCSRSPSHPRISRPDPPLGVSVGLGEQDRWGSGAECSRSTEGKGRTFPRSRIIRFISRRCRAPSSLSSWIWEKRVMAAIWISIRISMLMKDPRTERTLIGRCRCPGRRRKEVPASPGRSGSAEQSESDFRSLDPS